MTVFLWDHKLTYVSTPKVASTSLIHMFFKVENDRPFKSFRINGKKLGLHQYYKVYDFVDLPHERIADHVRLTVVRDPVRRLLSCYSNVVVHHGYLSLKTAGLKLSQSNLQPDPDLATFLDHFEDYSKAVPVINQHVKPVVQILGKDPSYFEGIFPIERLSDFTATVGRILGQELSAPRLQTSGPKIGTDVLTSSQVSKIKRFYAEDYDIWGNFFG